MGTGWSSSRRGGASGGYAAREARADERARLWDEAVDYYSGYDTYRVRAGEREISIVVLERAQAGRAPARGE
jgi:hypothetical protein